MYGEGHLFVRCGIAVTRPEGNVIDERPEPPSGGRRRALLVAGGLTPVVLGIGLIVAAVLIFVGQGKSNVRDADVAAVMRKAGCTLATFPAQARTHLKDINAHPRYNSFPPTSGPHYFAPVAWGLWPAPLQQVQVVHNLEHGGIVIQFGDKVRIGSPTLDKLVRFYASDRRLMLMAPLPKLGKTIALEAWTVPEQGANRANRGTGRLAKCTRVDEAAFGAFVDAYRDRGPESRRQR
jgi:hypothetical protein